MTDPNLAAVVSDERTPQEHARDLYDALEGNVKAVQAFAVELTQLAEQGGDRRQQWRAGQVRLAVKDLRAAREALFRAWQENREA